VSALIIDTNAYSLHRRGDGRAVAALRAADEIHFPLIVLGELLAGFAGGRHPERNRDELAEFMATPRVHLLKPDEKTAHHYAEVVVTLGKAGTPIPTNDVWIAAMARQARLPLLTFDAHFARVPGLELVLAPS
jgi:tRNA(fMet)-specific endonuclease VapC